MTRTIRVIAAIAAVYLVIVFITWEFNPGDWTQEGRLFAAFTAAFAAITTILWEDMF